MKFIFAILMILGSVKSFAAAAEELTCNGTDNKTGQEISFQVELTGSDPDAGFTNQQAIIVSIGGKQLSSPIIFQMFNATDSNKCSVSGGEIMYKDALVFGDQDMTTLKASCGQDTTFDVIAKCEDAF